jgi:hypothetical protein
VRRLMRSVVGFKFGKGGDGIWQMACVPGTLDPAFRENNLDY